MMFALTHIRMRVNTFLLKTHLPDVIRSTVVDNHEAGSR